MAAPPRVREPELMDAPGLDPAQHAHALAGLARLNWVSGGARASWPALRAMARSSFRAGEAGAAAPVVLDVATGSGDLPVALDRLLRREGIAPHWILADMSSVALAHAVARASAAGLQFTAVQVNAARDALPQCDIALCNTFLHHLDPSGVVDVLRAMARAARVGGVVLDLCRSRMGLFLVQATARIVTRSAIVHTDAVLSMRAAYTRAELHDLAARAELTEATVEHVRPVRLRLSWRRSQ